ncbi:MAG TPA: hypothetical protein ENN53_06785 [Candidatus Acetothermia bacterium]|nr:hypothetical protein [Candidatus Acetothermia bacterium]
MSGYLFAVGAFLLLLAAAAMVAALVWGQPEVAIPGIASFPEIVLRILLGIWAAVLVWAAAVFARISRSRLVVRRALQKPGPRGMILITAETVREMAGLLLREELGLHRFRVRVRPKEGGLALHVALHLPPGEEVPALAERLQGLLAQEISVKTGLDVPEVQIAVLGTARPSRS